MDQAGMSLTHKFQIDKLVLHMDQVGTLHLNNLQIDKLILHMGQDLDIDH